MKTLRFSLDGAWEFRRTDDGSPGEWMAGRVPGCVQTDLMAAGRLADPFFGMNEDAVQWVGRSRWAYRRRFDAPALPAGARAYLVFEGLDTFARVLLNGQPVGSADNMFMPWHFDVTEALAAGDNEVCVLFDSTEGQAKALAAAYGVPLASVARTPNAPFVRKAPCHFGWDWGPTLLTVGIWRPVRLEIIPRALIAALDAWGDPAEDGTGTLHVATKAQGPAMEGLTLEVAAKAPKGRTVVGRAEAPLQDGRAAVAIPVAGAELWWPNGLGGQPLYRLTLRLRAGRKIVDERAVRVGIRRLELVREPDAWGRSFHFRVNGRAFFAKGANWIPADAFPARVTTEAYRRLVADCAGVGMNMLRVWGGGYFEDERFYDACDECGILVWQDFLFSCALYPGDDDAFAENVRLEAEAAVRRLRSHTCLAVWAGNNEIESGWFEWGWSKTHPERVWRGYERIFHDILPAAVAAFDGRRAYIPSSPTSHEVGHPNDPASGDSHYWNVWHGQGDHRNYLDSQHRFVSEFGFQSIPAMETMCAAIPGDQMRLDSPAMLQHQKSSGGNEKIDRAVRQWFGPSKDFAALAYLSQVYQALALQTGVEHWRRSAPRTMGALYWQANDCWPVLSWASLDYFGRWKALHYAARRFFAPYLVSGLSDEQGVRVWTTADFEAAPADAELTWQVRTHDGRLLRQGRRAERLEPGKTSEPLELCWADVSDEGAAALYAVAELRVNGKAVGRALLLSGPPAGAPLADPGIRTRVRRARAGAVVEVAASHLALAACLTAEGIPGRFADNFFDLLPGERRAVRLLTEEPLDAAGVEGLARRLRVMSLYDARIPRARRRPLGPQPLTRGADPIR
jgi:beta-mannosidase